jgi:hypothetical protein
MREKNHARKYFHSLGTLRLRIDGIGDEVTGTGLLLQAGPVVTAFFTLTSTGDMYPSNLPVGAAPHGRNGGHDEFFSLTFVDSLDIAGGYGLKGSTRP